MYLDYFIQRLEKLKQENKGFDFFLGRPLTQETIDATEDSLGIRLPEKLRDFFVKINGLKTMNPSFEIVDLEKLDNVEGRIHFATFDDSEKVHLDTACFNAAGEWDIINVSNGYMLTLTIGSFWSNKVWHWLEKGRPIWRDNWWIETANHNGA